MLDKKSIHEKIKSHYLSIFMKREDNYVKQDMTSYATSDDWKDVQYVGEEFQNDTNILKFQIKKSHLRLRLKVKISDPIKRESYNDIYLTLYHDIFYLKKKNPIKDKLLDITDTVDYDELLKSVKGDTVFHRNLKLGRIKLKL